MKKKRKVLATWKVILIVIASIIGLMGVTTLTMYLLGYFNEEIINPNDISFVQNENYNAKKGMFEVSENFELTLTSTTQDVTEREVTLSLSGATSENGYIDNGIIRVPEKVRLNTPFQVTLSSSYNDDLEMNYINGGITTLKATSENGLIQPTSAVIAVDVPVYEVSGYLYDVADSEMNELTNVVVGSQFKVKLNYTPSESEKLYSGDENKLFFYYNLEYNDIELDYTTHTFTAKKISEANGDKITILTFSSAKYQKEFLAEYNAYLAENPTYQDSFTLMNQRANLYFGENQLACKKLDIELKVVDVTVDNFRLTNTSFKGTVDKYLNLASSSTSPVFDGNLGVIIRDSENTPLNSVYAKNVGIAYIGETDGVKIKGSSVVKVVEQMVDGKAEYTLTEENYDINASYKMQVSEDGLTRTYYFVLPDTNGSSDASNYSYKISATEDNVEQFKSALFVEENGELAIYFNASQTFGDLPVINIDFTMSAESELHWDDQSTINLVYDSDAGISDSVDLSTQISVPENNIYQTVRYFLFFDNGSLEGNFNNAISTKQPVEYSISGENPDISVTIPGSATGITSIYLYELNDSMLTANGPYDKNIYLIFATVRTDAEGNIIMKNGKYDIVLTSNYKNLVIDSTLKFSDMDSTLNITSSVQDYFLHENELGENFELYIPSVLVETEDETTSDTFKFDITLSNSLNVSSDLNEMQELYNSQNLKIEFRDADGEKTDYLSFENVSFNSNELASTITISGDVVISSAYTNTEGDYFTAYLVFNNGKTVREKQLTFTYETYTFDNFMLYAQKVDSAEYQFILDYADNPDENPYINPVTNEPGVVQVKITADDVSIEWNGQTVTDPESGSPIKKLSDLLQVSMFDQFGRLIMVDDVASYTLQELNGLNYVMIGNNEITGFRATGGNPVDTILSATATSKDGSQVTTNFQINFTIQSEGVSKVEYDATEFVKDIDDEMTELQGNIGEVTIKKYLTTDDVISLKDLINVYIGDNTTPLQDLTFKLDSAYLSEMSSKNLTDLFRTASNQPAGGMISLYSDVSCVDNYLVDTTDNIVALKIMKPFAQETTIYFNVTDSNNLVNIKLNFVIYQNVEVTPKFSTYESQYEGYLTTAGNGDLRNKVFGGEVLDLNTYYPISLSKTKDDQPDTSFNWGGGRLNILTDSTDLVDVAGSALVFADVKTYELVNVTIVYGEIVNGQTNTYAFKQSLSFVINPNYAIVENDKNIDLSQIGDGINIENTHYNIYKATDYINYMKGATLDDSSKVEFAGNFRLDRVEGGILTSDSNSPIVKRDQENPIPYTAPLGTYIETSFNLTYIGDDAGTGDFQALYFVARDENQADFVGTGKNSITFNVGYGIDAYDTINKIFEENNNSYKLLENENGYQLILLESMAYKLNDGWYGTSTENRYLIFNSDNFNVGKLDQFNFDTEIRFQYNNIDTIIVQVRLTKVGLDYIVYTNDYPFDIITGNADTLVENNVFESIVAGIQSKQIVYIDKYDENFELSKDQVGFHYKVSEGSNYGANLTISDITAGYENLISIVDGATTGSKNSIKINSIVDNGDEIYAIILLTLSQNSGSGNIYYEMYFRIKVEANYILQNVFYPYNNEAEYINQSDFTINFEEEFNSTNASGDAVGRTRFAKLQNKETGDVVDADAKYKVYDVAVNGESVAKENWEQYLDLTLDENTGILTAHVKNEDALITIKIAKSYFENDIEIVNSERVYTIILNNTPEYVSNVYKIEEDEEITLGKDGKDYIENIQVGENEYKYFVDLKENSESGIQTPVTNMNAHFTSEDGKQLLVPFIKEGDVIYATNEGGTLKDELEITAEILETLNGEETDRVYITVEELENGISKITLPSGLSVGEQTSVTEFYVKTEKINYFMFEKQANSEIFELSFKTVSAYTQDMEFSIGIYTTYENAFNINFKVNGGYTVTFTENVLNGTPFASGKEYQLSDFVEKIQNIGGSELQTAFTYKVADETDASVKNRIKIDGQTFTVAHSERDFGVVIVAEYWKDEQLLFTFSFTLNFAKSFDNSVVREYKDDNTYYSQHTLTFDLTKGNFYDAVKGYLEPEDSIVDENSFIFQGDGSSYGIQIENVSEEQTATENMTIVYMFNGNQIFTFQVNYVYNIKPNVVLENQYPTPDGSTETGEMIGDEFVETEFVNDKDKINNFFNTAPNFTTSDAKGRVTISPQGQEGVSYQYQVGINVTEISNVRLVATGNTNREMTSAGILVNTTLTESTMPTYNFEFNLQNNGTSGYVLFTITVNQVSITYRVNVSNSSVVTVETNATNRENSVEKVFAEDMKNYEEENIFGYSRMLKYKYLTGISVVNYWVRFEKENEAPLIYQLQITKVGSENVEDLGKSNDGYTFEGVYTTKDNALNKVNKSDERTIFETNPYITNRIVLVYAGYKVSSSVAEIYLYEDAIDNTEKMSEFEFEEDDVQTEKTLKISYTFANDKNTTQHATGFSYSVKLTVEFEVVSDAVTQHETLQAGNDYNLLSLQGFGIRNARTGELYTSTTMAENGEINLQVYGFSDLPVAYENGKVSENGKYDALQVEAGQIHDQLIKDGIHYTGIKPRAGMSSINVGSSTDFTNNYITLTAQRQNEKNVDWKIQARGAANMGNFVMLKITYSTTFAGKTISVSDNLKVLVNPAYKVLIKTDDTTNAYNQAQEVTLEGGGNHNTYMTNTAETPYIITIFENTVSNSKQSTEKLYAALGEYPLLQANQGSTNLGYTFTYKYTSGSGEFNSYAAGISLTDGWTGKPDNQSSSLSFTVTQPPLGDKNYYIDAVDPYDFQIRIYFRVRAGLNPEIADINKTTLKEGDDIEFGSVYKSITQSKISLSGILKDNGIEFVGDYDLHYSNITKKDDAKVVPEVYIDGSKVTSLGENGLVYVYYDASGNKYATNTFSNVPVNTEFSIYVNYQTLKVSPDSKNPKTVYVQYGTDIKTPTNQNVSSETNPTFNADNEVQVSLRGLDAYVYNSATFGIGGEPSYASKIQNFYISSVKFEVEGSSIPCKSENPSTTNISTKAGGYIYNDSKKAMATTESKADFTVPYFEGKYYGTSNMIGDVVMVITLSEIGGTNSTELRLNVTIERSPQGTLKGNEFIDGEVIDKGDFNTSEDGTATVYNDTLQIQLDAGTKLEYAITTSASEPAKDSSEWKELNNTRNYTHSEFVRISEEKKIDASSVNGKTSYYIHIRNAAGNYLVKYGNSNLIGYGNNEKNNSSISSLAEFSDASDSSGKDKITYNIENINELNSSGYTTRNVYTIVAFTPTATENETSTTYYYQQSASFNLYPYYESITPINTTASEYEVSDYYKVEGGSTGNTDDYYVITPANWTSGHITYNEYNNLTAPSQSTIANMPWAYSYKIEGDATIDSTGTITTARGFDVKTNNLIVTVYMKVSGYDGQFRDSQGIELGTVKFYLNEESSVSSSAVISADANSTKLGVIGDYSLVNLKEGEKVYKVGSPTETSYSKEISTPASTDNYKDRFVIPVNTTLDLSEIDSSKPNVEYRVVKENSKDNSTVIITNNIGSYTYTSVGEYTPAIVRTYLKDGEIVFDHFGIFVDVYDPVAGIYVSHAREKGNGSGNQDIDQNDRENMSEILNDDELKEGTWNYYDVDTDEYISIDCDETMVKTYNIVAVNSDTSEIRYYILTIIVYETGKEYNVALTPYSTYALSKLFGESTVYEIDSDTHQEIVRDTVNFSDGINTIETKTYYVKASDGTVKMYTVNFNIYNSSASMATSTWIEDEFDDKGNMSISKDTISKAIGLTEEEGKTITIYSLDANNIMTEITENYTLTKASGESTSFTRYFIVKTENEDTSLNYTYYTITFYAYEKEINISSSTVYTNAYRLSNLDNLVKETIGGDLSGYAVSWYVYNTNALSLISTIEIDADFVENGIYMEDEKIPVYYVNINGVYYKVNLTLYSASLTNNNIIIFRDAQGNITLSEIAGTINEKLNIVDEEATITSKFYALNENNTPSASENTNFNLNDVEATKQKYLYVVTIEKVTEDATETTTIYAIITLTFIVQTDVTDEKYVFESAITSGTFSLNTITSEVRTRLGISQVEYYEYSTEGQNYVSIISLFGLEEEKGDYILRPVYVKNGVDEDGKDVYTKILILLKNNQPKSDSEAEA